MDIKLKNLTQTHEGCCKIFEGDWFYKALCDDILGNRIANFCDPLPECKNLNTAIDKDDLAKDLERIECLKPQRN